jgi:hypothetical protein
MLFSVFYKKIVEECKCKTLRQVVEKYFSTKSSATQQQKDQVENFGTKATIMFMYLGILEDSIRIADFKNIIRCRGALNVMLTADCGIINIIDEIIVLISCGRVAYEPQIQRNLYLVIDSVELLYAKMFQEMSLHLDAESRKTDFRIQLK